jgi:hypothetical protein
MEVIFDGERPWRIKGINTCKDRTVWDSRYSPYPLNKTAARTHVLSEATTTKNEMLLRTICPLAMAMGRVYVGSALEVLVSALNAAPSVEE